MNTKTKRRIPIIVYITIAITILCVLLFVSWLWYIERYEGVATSPNTFGDFGKKQYFAIDPETILTTLEHGETDVFTPEVTTPENPIFENNFEWQQTDYLKIVDTLNRFVWNEALDDWSLYYMNFSTACHDDLKGLGFAEIAYFKTIPVDILQKDYTVRAFQIVPQYGYVVSSGGATFPQPLFDRWENVNLNKLRILAEDALKIAEENGGQAARLSVQNQCTIHMRLSGDAGWKVFIYANDTGSSIFRMEVDASTGKMK